MNNNFSKTLCIVNYKNEMYAGGYSITNETYGNDNGIARWDGTSWNELGLIGLVRCLYEFEDTLYVGGWLDSIIGSDIRCDGLVKWDGTNWHEVENLPQFNNPNPKVSSISEYNNELYIGGSFYIDNLDTTYSYVHIIKYNGNQWLELNGDVVTSSVVNMEVYDNYLYCLTEYLGQPNLCMKKWDGYEWSDNGLYPSNRIFSMKVFNNELWIGGDFSSIGNLQANNIAKWNGSIWCSMEDSIMGIVRLLEEYNNELYIGGNFQMIDTLNINYIAKWTGGSYVDTCSSPVSIIEIPNKTNDVTVYPNPAQDILNIDITNDILQVLEVYNQTGQLIEKLKCNNNNQSIDISHLQTGTYFIRVIGKEKVYSKKFIILR